MENTNITNVSVNNYGIIQEIFGYMGNTIVVIKIIPQIIKIFRTKSTKDLSMVFIILGLIGGMCSIVYGLMLQEMPIMLRSFAVFIEIIIIFIAKLYYDAIYIISENKNKNLNK